MKLESDGILITLTPINGIDSVARIFTRDFGVMRGVMRGAASGRNRRPPLVGQFGNMSWNARLDSQLGAFHWEPTRNMAAIIMGNPESLGLMNAAMDLITTFLPERESYPALFGATMDLFTKLTTNDAGNAYREWEVKLLSALGYALDLSCCSGCGTHENLHYLSPRTGRAVCDTCAAPYIDKVFKLPITLDTTLHFLSHAAEIMGATIPQSRNWIKNTKNI